MTTYWYCASWFILNTDSSKTLFVFHKRLQRRIQPWGHVDEGETHEETVLREVLEETWLYASFHPKHTSRLWIEWSYEYGEEMITPYLIRKYDYKKSNKPYDFHIDSWYILLVEEMEICNYDDAIEQVQWFTKEEGLEAVWHDPKLKYLIKELML